MNSMQDNSYKERLHDILKDTGFNKIYNDFYKLDLKPLELHIFTIVYSYCDSAVDSEYKGSVSYLIKNLNIAKNTALKSLKTLENIGYIIKIQGNCNTTTKYKINYNIILDKINTSRPSAKIELVQNLNQCKNYTSSSAKIELVPSAKIEHSQNIYQNNNQNNTHLENAQKNKEQKKKNNSSSKKSALDDIQKEQFAEFWQIYPKKKSKKDALKIWNKIQPNDELFRKIMSALETQKRLEWKKMIDSKDMKYIPLPTTWLNRESWEDEIYLPEQPVPQQVPAQTYRSEIFNLEQKKEQERILAQMYEKECLKNKKTRTINSNPSSLDI